MTHIGTRPRTSKTTNSTKSTKLGIYTKTDADFLMSIFLFSFVVFAVLAVLPVRGRARGHKKSNNLGGLTTSCTICYTTGRLIGGSESHE